MRQRFQPGALATENQRDLVRRLTTPDNPAASDPTLTANAAWRLAGNYLPCEERDAAVIAFFGEDPEQHSQTSGEDRADQLLSRAENAARWEAHPQLNEAAKNAVHLALTSVEAWGIRHRIFHLPHLEHLDIYKAFRVEAEATAARLQQAGTVHMGTLRKQLREMFTARLKELEDPSKLSEATWIPAYCLGSLSSSQRSTSTSSPASSPSDANTQTRPRSLWSIFSWAGRFWAGWRP